MNDSSWIDWVFWTIGLVVSLCGSAALAGIIAIHLCDIAFKRTRDTGDFFDYLVHKNRERAKKKDTYEPF